MWKTADNRGAQLPRNMRFPENTKKYMKLYSIQSVEKTLFMKCATKSIIQKLWKMLLKNQIRKEAKITGNDSETGVYIIP